MDDHPISEVSIFIIKTNSETYEEKKIYRILLKKKLGEGSYGIVFLLDNGDVIKIFKKSLADNPIQQETNFLIPINNENRELIFYYKYIKSNKVNNYIINAYAIGILKDNYQNYKKNSYFIILPYCIPFYSIYNVFNKPLIQHINGLQFTLKVMKRLLEIIIFFEKEYNMINIDIKLNNFMFTKKTKKFEDLIMLDFSIIKTIDKKNKTKNIYSINDNYYIWPKKEILLDYISSYSVCINGLELLFGHNSINTLPNKTKMNNFLKIIKDNDKNKDKRIYNLFYKGISLEINGKELFDIIKKMA